MYPAGKLARNAGEAGLFILGLAGVFVYAAPGEHALWRPMAAAAVSLLAASFALFVRSRSTD